LKTRCASDPAAACIVAIATSRFQSGASNPAAVKFRRLNDKVGLPRQREQVFVAGNHQIGFATVGEIEEGLILGVAA
jgi:hypothetical protein